MFLRIRTRLLATSGITLLLLAALALLTTIELRSLNPAIEHLNQLSTIAVQARDVTLVAQATSADLSDALAGGTGDARLGQDFDRQIGSLETSVADLEGTLSTAQVSDDIRAQHTQLRQMLAEYRNASDNLFAMIAARIANPTPQTRAAAERAVEPASRISNRFKQQIQAFSATINAEAATARQAVRQQISRIIAILGGTALLIAIVTSLVYTWTALVVGQPVSKLAAVARQIENGDLAARAPIAQRDEIGDLARSFNAMADAVLRGRAALEEQNRHLEDAVQSRTAELQTSVAQLEAALIEQRSLRATLQGVSTPVLPVAKGVLLMPLIGALDASRATVALNTLLHTIEAQRARTVILDITGLSMMDSSVATTLLQAARATSLLGAQLILAGVGPEVAQALAALQIGLDGLIQPASDLEAAVALALGAARR